LTKRAWNCFLISLVTIWLPILIACSHNLLCFILTGKRNQLYRQQSYTYKFWWETVNCRQGTCDKLIYNSLSLYQRNHDFYKLFYVLVFSSVLVLFEKVYQTFKTVFDHISKHLSVHQKYSLHIIFSNSFSLFGNVVKCHLFTSSIVLLLTIQDKLPR